MFTKYLTWFIITINAFWLALKKIRFSKAVINKIGTEAAGIFQLAGALKNYFTKIPRIVSREICLIFCWNDVHFIYFNYLFSLILSISTEECYGNQDNEVNLTCSAVKKLSWVKFFIQNTKKISMYWPTRFMNVPEPKPALDRHVDGFRGW